MVTPSNSRPRFSLIEWLRQGFTAGTVITVLTIAGGFVASEARHDAESQEIERRLTKLETTYIPRAERDSTESLWRTLLEDINRRLDRIESTLETRQ